MAQVVLSQRLQALADMVTIGRRVADVGCDHGFVSIYLVQKGISPRVVAMDVRTGPLSKAQEHIAEYGLSDYIEARLSDGLQALQQGEADALVCAGMGGRLMEKILTEGRSKAQGMCELILQPQSELMHFRRFLRKEGYRLLEERIVQEEGKYYFLMKVCREDAKKASGAEKDNDRLQVLYDKYGELLLQRRDTVLQEYLQISLHNMHQIEASLLQKADGTAERVQKRLAEIRTEIADLEKALAFFR